ncbi:MAG: Protein-L-isoaspartate O-methyltransferase [Verrucomicrobia subdivision 3 bacterium]|nr:Protein-L-isoaspartate O-methyltransferase [Limisphaerales bacterium]MCS1414091.1 Protein-L-isoaspartate O-methyltransferase [Limisphaerales bacterium]
MSLSPTPAEAMIQEQLLSENRGISYPDVIAAMRHVPRDVFVPEIYRAAAFTDRPLPISHGQTISQPFIVAYMTEAINPKSTDRVLEIGTGSGYQTAILAEIVKEVFTIEMVPALAKQASTLLNKLGFTNIHYRQGDGSLGWPEAAPFDAILVTCAPTNIPTPLLEQLDQHGKLVIPTGTDNSQQLKRITHTDDVFHHETLLPVRFVPMKNLRR